MQFCYFVGSLKKAVMEVLIDLFLFKINTLKHLSYIWVQTSFDFKVLTLI